MDSWETIMYQAARRGHSGFLRNKYCLGDGIKEWDAIRQRQNGCIF